MSCCVKISCPNFYEEYIRETKVTFFFKPNFALISKISYNVEETKIWKERDKIYEHYENYEPLYFFFFFLKKWLLRNISILLVVHENWSNDEWNSTILNHISNVFHANVRSNGETRSLNRSRLFTNFLGLGSGWNGRSFTIIVLPGTGCSPGRM